MMGVLLVAIWILGAFAASNVVVWWMLFGTVMTLGLIMSTVAKSESVESRALKNVKELMEDSELIEFIKENRWVINAMWFPTFLFVATAAYLYSMSLTIPAVVMLITSYFMWKINKQLVMFVKETFKR